MSEPESYGPEGGHMGITGGYRTEMPVEVQERTARILEGRHNPEDCHRTEVDLEDTAALMRRYETALEGALFLLKQGASRRRVIAVLDQALNPD